MDVWVDQTAQRFVRVLFSRTLDEVLPREHPLRTLVEILDQLDFRELEAAYAPGVGRRAIHPRVLVSVIIWGLLSGVRSSRRLEEALGQRVDFLWLTGGLFIDHTTLSNFRHSRRDELQSFFRQTVLLARDIGLLDFQLAAFDGTRVKAGNRRSGTRTPEQLLKDEAQAGQTFDQLEAQAIAEESQPEAFRLQSSPDAASDPARRRTTIAAAIAELTRLKATGEPLANRLPITDPDSRIMPNKDGGFAPNDTPTAMVDVTSGLIIDADVSAAITDESLLLPALARVQDMFGDDAKPRDMLVDGAFPTGHNLTQLEAADITCYSPTDVTDPTQHPARRADLTQPVSAEQLALLPLQTVPNAKSLPPDKRQQFAKGAFVYDAPTDVWFCPQGQVLTYRNTSPEKRKGQPPVLRRRYESDPRACAACPLKGRCLQAGAKQRTLSRDQYEEARERQATRMAGDAAQAIDKDRRHAGETPFAYLKQQLGCRQFLLRGLDRVRQEWRWLSCAFNLRKLLTAFQARAGPSARGTPQRPQPADLHGTASVAHEPVAPSCPPHSRGSSPPYTPGSGDL